MAGTKKTAADAVETKTAALAPDADKKEAAKTSKGKTAVKKTETRVKKPDAPLKETKAPAKRTVKPEKPVKGAVYVQFAGKEFSEKDLTEAVTKAYEALGNKVSDIKTLDIYLKPEENTAYYAVNGEGSAEYKIEL